MQAISAIVNALLSGVASGRCYPQFRPANGTLPAAVWNVISCVPQGRVTQSAGTGLWDARVQVDCIDTTFAGCMALVESVRSAMHLKSGTFGGKTVIASVLDQFGADAADIDAQLYIKSVDFTITFYD